MTGMDRLTVNRRGAIYRIDQRATRPASSPIGFVVKQDDGWHAYLYRHLRANLALGVFPLKREAVTEVGTRYAGKP